MTAFPTRGLEVGATVRKFPSDPWREVESVEFVGSNPAGHLFYLVRYVGGGAETWSTAEPVLTPEETA